MKAKLQKLEMLRGFTALYVFAGHFLPARVISKDSVLGITLRFGQEAVMLFFLLSGFVVYYSTAKHGDKSFSSYFARRVRRIYPIFLLALAISYLNFVLLRSGQLDDFQLKELLGNVFMLQDFKGGKPGVLVAPFCGNVALWSLSYEWWFYMLFFPMYRFVPVSWQIHVAAALSLFGFITFSLHANQASLFLMYFILWWSGAELGRSYLAGIPQTLASQRWPVFYLTALSGVAAVPVLISVVDHTPLSFGIHPVLELRHFCACLVFLVTGLLWARMRWFGFRPIFRVFAFVAPISYALYVFHYPLAVTSSYLAPLGNAPLQFVGYIVITFLIAYLAEVPFQNWINRITTVFVRRPPAVRPVVTMPPDPA